MNKLFLCLKASFVGLITALVITPGATAQTGRAFEQPDIFPEGRLEIGTVGYATKYVGEFTDNNIGQAYGLTTRYTLPFLPEISLGARYIHGYLRYDRRHHNRFITSFSEQFPESDFPGAKENGVERQTKIDSYELLAYLNMFPHQSLNYYIFAGGGMLAFQPQDIVENPITWDGSRRNYPKITEDKLYNLHAIGGLGIDYYITSNISFGMQASFHVLKTDYLDGFAGTMEGGESAMDGYGDFGIKLSYNLFSDSDADNDGLLNEEEALLGINPYESDSDEDGVTDFEEVRTFSSNPLMQDTDSDGLNDSEEAYQLHSNILSADSDADGLTDFDEARLYKTNALLKDSDGDNLADAEELKKGANPMFGDTDGDGMADIHDDCPSVFGLRENMGCPGTPTLAATIRYEALEKEKIETVIRDTVYISGGVRTVQENELFTPYGINFETGKSIIREESYLILGQVYEWLRNSPYISKVEIRGHTDSDGSVEANQKLSEDRANAVRTYLIGKGIEAQRMETKGFGQHFPVAGNDDEQGKARNRRIEFFVKKVDVKMIGEN